MGVLRFSEVFDGAFVPRTAANFVDSNTSPPPVPQNIPGQNYVTESGFYSPSLTAPTGDFGTIGLANAGSRLRAILNNVPTGARVFVSANRVNFINGNPVAAGSGLVARLIQSETGAFAPAAVTTTLDGIPAVELPVSNGSASAVWEVLSKNLGDDAENADFPVWVLPAGTVAGAATVNGSFAPAPPAFAGGGSASTSLPVPRFTGDPLAGRSLFTLAACTVAPTPLAITTTCASVGHYRKHLFGHIERQRRHAAYNWTASGLPAGLFLNPTTGVISGVIQSAGTYPVIVTLQDAAKTSVSAHSR